MRTQYGRITNVASKSGKGADDDLTIRDKWIKVTFSFLERHIVRVPSRTSFKVSCVEIENNIRFLSSVHIEIYFIGITMQYKYCNITIKLIKLIIYYKVVPVVVRFEVYPGVSGTSLMSTSTG